MYPDSDNWFKASIEYENESIQRLGSGVANNGFYEKTALRKVLFLCGDRGTRTPDLCVANASLSQLSYIPVGVVIRNPLVIPLRGTTAPASGPLILDRS